MKRYDCYYTNDFNSEYPALSREAVDGDWVRFEDAAAEIHSLNNQLTAITLERDALKQALVKVADPNIIRTSESFRQIALDALEPK